ncbi:unnamed protein product, partial [Dibothriocephalus latus]
MDAQFSAIPPQHEEADVHPEATHLGKDLEGMAEPEHSVQPTDTHLHEEDLFASQEAHPDFTKPEEDLTSDYHHEEHEKQRIAQTPDTDDHVIPHEMSAQFAAIPPQHEEADVHPEISKGLDEMAEPEHPVHPTDTLAHEEEPLPSHEAHHDFTKPEEDLTGGYHHEEKEEEHQHMAQTPDAFEHSDDHLIPHEMDAQFAAIPPQHEEADVHAEATHLGKDLEGMAEPDHTVHPTDTLVHEEEPLASHEAHLELTKPEEGLTGGYHHEDEEHQQLAQTPDAFEHGDGHVIPHEMAAQFAAIPAEHEETDVHPEAMHLGKDLEGMAEPEHTVHPTDTLVHEEEPLASHEAHLELTKPEEDLTGGYYHEDEEHQHLAQTPDAFEHVDGHVLPHEMDSQFAAIPPKHEEADVHAEATHLGKDLHEMAESEHTAHPTDIPVHEEEPLPSHEAHHEFTKPEEEAVTGGYRHEEEEHQHLAETPDAFEHGDDHLLPNGIPTAFVQPPVSQEEVDFEAEAERHFSNVGGAEEYEHKMQSPETHEQLAPGVPVHEPFGQFTGEAEHYSAEHPDLLKFQGAGHPIIGFGGDAFGQVKAEAESSQGAEEEEEGEKQQHIETLSANEAAHQMSPPT